MEYNGKGEYPSAFRALIAEAESLPKPKILDVSYSDGKDKLHELALNYYNRSNVTQYEDAELVSCKVWLAIGFFHHINFKAKSKNPDSALHSLELFFAEVKFYVDGFTVRKCCIVEPKDAVTSCDFCGSHPSEGLPVYHPRESDFTVLPRRRKAQFVDDLDANQNSELSLSCASPSLFEASQPSNVSVKHKFLTDELNESRIAKQNMEYKCRMLELSYCLLVAGGYDGYLQLLGLDSYSPFQDLKKPLAAMNFARLHASAANLNGEFFVFGGMHGGSWCDIVESYDATRNQWLSRPPLSEKKGHLAGVSLDNKIFAIGGVNEGGYLSDVEMLDVNSAKWVLVGSMPEKRCSPAAAEINNVFYVVGGYNEGGYLNSVERFDPREGSWTRLESMNTKRGRHSLAVLNEKLYALGGYDGGKMVSTVEVFDPRVGVWTLEGSMNEARGYFGAFVLRDSIYVLGGLNDNGTILDMVERYMQNRGWRATNLKGLGRRCAFCVSCKSI